MFQQAARLCRRGGYPLASERKKWYNNAIAPVQARHHPEAAAPQGRVIAEIHRKGLTL